MVLLLDQLPGLPAVQELLALETSALRARWEASDADALEREIDKYKGALSQVLEELKRLGGRPGGQVAFFEWRHPIGEVLGSARRDRGLDVLEKVP